MTDLSGANVTPTRPVTSKYGQDHGYVMVRLRGSRTRQGFAGHCWMLLPTSGCSAGPQL